MNATAQYSLRRAGDFRYRYSDDLGWSLSSGYYLDLSHENTLAAGLVFSGEHKRQDTLAGAATTDTAIDAAYLGLQITYSRGSGLYAELAADFPLRQRTVGLQAVPDARLSLAITLRPRGSWPTLARPRTRRRGARRSPRRPRRRRSR